MEQPMIQSMTRIRCGKTRCQIAGTLTPAVEFDRAPDDWIYFPPHALLWADTVTTFAVAPVPRMYDPAARPGHRYLPWSVEFSMHLEYMRTPGTVNQRDPGSYRTIWLRLSGPGRVAVQSAHKREQETGIPDHLSFPTTKRW
jgi:hypothetical protein